MSLSASHVVSAIGAIVAGLGALAAARGTMPLFVDKKSGSVSLTAPMSNKDQRIRTAWWQDRMRWWLGAVGVGSLLQAVANFI